MNGDSTEENKIFNTNDEEKSLKYNFIKKEILSVLKFNNKNLLRLIILDESAYN